MPVPLLKLTFANNQYVDGYRSLFETAGQIHTNNGLDIARADYKSGYCIFEFDTSSSFCHGEPQEWKRNGTLQSDIDWVFG